MANAALRLVGQDEADKKRALEAALAQIDRAFGKGSVMKLGDKGKIVEIESVSTGSLGLDLALGIGGLPKRPRRRDLRAGKLGQDHAGPARRGRGAEGAAAPPPSSTPNMRWIPSYAHKLGVNLDDLLVSQPDTGEQALEITDTLVRSGAVDVHRHRLGGGADAARPRSRARWATACPACRRA